MLPPIRLVAARLPVTGRSVEEHVTAIFTELDLPAAGTDHHRVLAVLRRLDPARG